MNKKGFLALEDGRVFPGKGAFEGVAFGEAVFNTSMSGYQEVLSDPSYTGQIVAMTYPLIGNTGVNSEDSESTGPCLSGFIVRELSRRASNWRSKGPLGDYLRDCGVPILSEVDTRTLTRHIRTRGAMRSVIAVGDWSPDELVRKAKESPGLEGVDLVQKVTTNEIREWTDPCPWMESVKDAPKRKVVVFDFGAKRNIMRSLVSLGCEVFVVPADTAADTVLDMRPDGVVLSNGPGDPAAVGYAVAEIAKLFGKVPIFGICLGHQLIALAAGAKTYKLKFGHRGANQPVLSIARNQVEITSQNHGFCLDEKTLPPEWEITHVNLNDNTPEGLRHKSLPIFSVQYHPEAAAGPHDAAYLFHDFIRLMQ